jgi:hypothetical protein
LLPGSKRNNSPAAFYFLFDTTAFSSNFRDDFPERVLRKGAGRGFHLSLSPLEHRNKSSKPLGQTNKAACQNGVGGDGKGQIRPDLA